jgi:hypothetical protein
MNITLYIAFWNAFPTDAGTLMYMQVQKHYEVKDKNKIDIKHKNTFFNAVFSKTDVVFFGTM